MAWRSAAWAGAAGSALILLAGCAGGGDAPPPPSSGGVVSAGSTSSLSPAPRIFDEAALEDGVRHVLVASYQLTDVGAVRCPSDQAVQAGISFDCTVVLGGVTKSVTLTVRGVDGTYEVAQPR